MRHPASISALLVLAVAGTVAYCAKEPSPQTPTESWVILEAPLPQPVELGQPHHEWSGRNDPLWVANVDVPDRSRTRYIEKLKAGISEEATAASKLKGITVTIRRTPVIDEEGRPVLDADGDPKETIEWVRQYWFEGLDQPTCEGEEVEGTGFVIPDGWEPGATERKRTIPGRRNGLPRGYMPPYGPPRK